MASNVWSGGTPTSSTTINLIFSGTTNLGTALTPLNQNIANPMILNSLSFNSKGGAFFLGGNPLQFNGASNTLTQNSSSAESIANNIDPNSNATLTLAGNGTGVITLAGIISKVNGGKDYAVVKTGSSTFVLSGANTYAGGTTINGGTLCISSTASLGATSGGLSLNAAQGRRSLLLSAVSTYL